MVLSVHCARLMWAFFSVCECASFPFGFEDGIWDLIILVLGYCLSFYFSLHYDIQCTLFSTK